jgi:hypothetical protein
MVSHPAGGEWEIHSMRIRKVYWRRTVDALVDRAAEQLQAGRDSQALGICRQVVMMNPSQRFDHAFWANAKPRP